MKKIGILGSRDLSCKILDWIVIQDTVEIIGVVAPPFKGWWDDRFKQTAQSHNLTIYENIEELIKQKPDVIFSLNYWKTIKKSQINSVSGGIINIHHSYLLKYRGRYSTSWAIVNARKLSNWIHGTTLHYISSELDNGPIIASYKCDILETDTAESLFKKVEILAYKMFKNHFQSIIKNEVTKFIEPDPNFYLYDRDSNKELKIKYGVPLNEVYDFVRSWSSPSVLNDVIPSYEIVQKAAVARIAIVVAVSAPTSLAIEIAEEGGVSLVGFARDNRHVCYSNCQRLD